MAEQTYQNHRHMPAAANIAFVLWAIAIAATTRTPWFGWNAQSVAAIAALGAVLNLIAISRIYTTRLQDRIILLEMKVRCAELLPAGDDARLQELSRAQVIALRFASDAELGGLLERAVAERLSPRAIKQAIRQWKADLLRT